ncbi:MAG: phosphatidylserine/phosphatidylglycerophosphate/cardiolipin synthase family protein [Vicinamibacterales bacterium]
MSAGIAVVLAAGLLIAQDQEILDVRSPVAARDGAFVDYVASLLGAPISDGDRYEALENGDQVFPAMLAAIDQASQRISFESFIFSDGAVADRFTDALGRAAARGVTVRLVLDAYGSSDLSEAHTRRLADAGAQIVWFNLLRPWTIEATNYRTHRKVLAIDGTVAFVGGVGVRDHWLGDARTLEEWRDTQFRVTGPAVRALEASFYENWIEAGGLSAPALDAEPPTRADDARSIVVWSNPTAGASNIKLLYMLSIAGARETIDIQSPYFIPDASTRGVLDEARRRGVRVRIVTEGETTDAWPVKHASRAVYQELLDAGYEIHEFAPAMMHVKALVVDGTWSIIGSVNFDNRSLELNDELAVAVADARLGARLTAAFEADLRRCSRLDAATWRDQRSLLGKALEAFWSYFGELF